MGMIAIIAGGTPPESMMTADMIIGVDRGALWIMKQGITLDVAIGDFDSVTTREELKIKKYAKKFLKYPIKKDKTDLELAIDLAIKKKPGLVLIYGVLGGRFDHEMGAIQMLLKLVSHNICGYIVDKQNKICIVRHKITLQKDKNYRYVSLVPISSDATLTLKGFVYDVRNKKIPIDSSLGISNEILGKHATVTVHNGLVMLVQSQDA